MSHTQPGVSIRGHSVLNQKPKTWVILVTWVTDLTWILALLCFAIKVFHFSPVPRSKNIALFAVFIVLAWLIQQLIWGGTLGHLIWRLRLIDPQSKKPIRDPRRVFDSQLVQSAALGLTGASTGIFLSVILMTGSFWVARDVFWKHPLLLTATSAELKPFVPETSPSSQWSVIPFFYSIGAWPKNYFGKPVLFSLPYEKGPPTHFIGHIIARWEMPDIKLTIEGPNTPDPDLVPDILRACLLTSWDTSVTCLKKRERALLKHIQEIRSAVGAKDWVVQWFEISNPSSPSGERPQGIYLSGQNANKAQDRYIFINSKGTQQAFILDRPLTPEGQRAKEIFEQSVRSQLMFSDLNAGRAWVDRQLAQTQLDELKNMAGNETFIPKLAEIEALLISKISVDPKTYDSYYHLGGLSFLLARHALKSRNLEWSAIAHPMVLSSYKYAYDIDPKDPRTNQLKSIWQDTKKF